MAAAAPPAIAAMGAELLEAGVKQTALEVSVVVPVGQAVTHEWVEGSPSSPSEQRETQVMVEF